MDDAGRITEEIETISVNEMSGIPDGKFLQLRHPFFHHIKDCDFQMPYVLSHGERDRRDVLSGLIFT